MKITANEDEERRATKKTELTLRRFIVAEMRIIMATR